MNIFRRISENTNINNKIANKNQGGGAYCTNNIVQKCLSCAVSLFLIFGMMPQNAFGLDNYAEDASGNWTINTAQGLVEFQEAVNGGNDFTGKTVTLAADIDLTGTSWAPIGGTESTPFSGTFDGAEHTISNLNNGLFGYISGATIQNLNLRKVTVNGAMNMGSICCQATNNSTIIGCIVIEGNLTIPKYVYSEYLNGFCAGGICGNADSSTITKCVVCAVGINSTGYLDKLGGICGSTTSASTITKCIVSKSSLNYNSTGARTSTLAGICCGNAATTDCFSACSYYNQGASNMPTGNKGYFNNERPGAGEGGLSTAEYEQKLRVFVDTNPEFVKWEKYIFTKTLKSSDFVCTHPKDMFYDGKGKTITIRPKPGITDIGAVTIKYYKVNSDGTLGAASTTLPTDAGRYKVKFDVASGPTNYAATALPAMF